MTLRGHSDELSLADLIQVTAQARRSCHVRLTALSETEDGFLEGDLFFDRGEPAFARFGDLEGASAVHAAVNVENLIYRVDGDTPLPRRNLAMGWQEIILEAARLRDHNQVPIARPSPVTTPPISGSISPESGVPQDAARITGTLPVVRPDSSTEKPRLGLVLGGSLALAILLVGALYTSGTWRHEPRTGTRERSTGSGEAVDAVTLTGARDSLPVLVFGPAPPSPDPTLGFRPTIICRLLVDVNGAVQSPSVYRPRPELAAFEAVALDAVRDYRFTPPQRNGQPVSAWVNWPVSFR